MLKNKAALKIQSFFASYRLKKQDIAKQAIESSPASMLLQAFDLRFQCMRAVAAAKFPISKPIEDAEQVARVIASIRGIAEIKGIVNLDAVERLFRQNILLAERIQAPYYYTIWPRSYKTGVDNQRLVDNAYVQLRSIVQAFNLPIVYHVEMERYTSSDVLSLAREIIQYASNTIIDVLVEPQYVSNHVLQAELSDAFEKILAIYMTPSFLSQSNENIRQMAQEITNSQNNQTVIL